MSLGKEIYSKTCLKRPLQNRQNKYILMTNGSLMKDESIAELEHSAILLTCIKQYSVFKKNLVFFLSDHLKQVLL